MFTGEFSNAITDCQKYLVGGYVTPYDPGTNDETCKYDIALAFKETHIYISVFTTETSPTTLQTMFSFSGTSSWLSSTLTRLDPVEWDGSCGQ